MTDYNLNINVKIPASTLGDAYIQAAKVIEALTELGEVTKVDLSDKVKSGPTYRSERV